MVQKIYGLIADNGGSTYLVWFKSKEDIEFVTDENNDFEEFWNCDMEYEYTFPMDLDLETCGFKFFKREII